MKVLTTHEFHYLQYEDGFYDPRNYTSNCYDDLLSVFDKVILVGRCKKVTKKPNCQRVDNEKIEFFALPEFRGLSGFIKQLICPTALWRCRKVVGMADRYWLRAPGPTASMVAFWLKRAKIPFYIHLVGDPDGGTTHIKPTWLTHLIGKCVINFARGRFRKLMRCSRGTLSVTESTLQKRYPSSMPENDFGASDARLYDDIFKKVKRTFTDEPFTIVTIGAMVDYKGHRYLLEALHKIKDKRRNWRLLIIGQGPLKGELEKMVDKLGFSDRVFFCGRIDWGPKLFEKMDNAHLFVLSSVAGEGMPRVVLEAMARALPVVATEVGGTHEILSPEVLAPPQNADALADKISALWMDPIKLQQLSSRNYEFVQRFRLERLQSLRKTWFQWMREHGNEPDRITWPTFARGKLPEDVFRAQIVNSNKEMQ